MERSYQDQYVNNSKMMKQPFNILKEMCDKLIGGSEAAQLRDFSLQYLEEKIEIVGTSEIKFELRNEYHLLLNIIKHIFKQFPALIQRNFQRFVHSITQP